MQTSTHSPDKRTEAADRMKRARPNRMQKAQVLPPHQVDLTLPQFGLPVVKVVVPGLEGVLPEMTPTEYVPGARAKAFLARKRLRIRPIFAAQ